MRRAIRIGATLVITGLCTAYLVWKIDVGKTLDILEHAKVGYFLLAVAIMVSTVWPMTWRWQQLLNAKGIHEKLTWLVRAYFVSYTAGQVLPTSIGGDAARIYETSARHPGRGGPVAASVLRARARRRGDAGALAAIGFVLAIGRYDVGAYLWVELAFVVATVFSPSSSSRSGCAGRLPGWPRPSASCASSGRCAPSTRVSTRTATTMRLLLRVGAVTLVLQTIRVLSIWCAGKAVGVDLSPRPYYVMGPLLFLVMLVPFTINGLAVRESFFVSFLGNLHVGADAAFATGFLFFVVTLALSLPGAVILAWEGLRGGARARVADGRPTWSSNTQRHRGDPERRASGSSAAWRASPAPDELVVVDHGSTDGTVELVRERFPEGEADRAGEPRLRRRQQRRHAGRLRALLPALELRCLGRRGRRFAA